MHDDATAQKMGFEGALVGGVYVYAYMSRLPMQHFGIEWLKRGRGDCRFHKPVYDGREIRCLGEVSNDGALSLTAAMGDVICATGQAEMPAEMPAFEAQQISGLTIPAPEDRPKGSPESLAEGTVLGRFDMTVSREGLAEYCDGVSETQRLYLNEGIVHPGQILHMANRCLTSNVYISPWMHVGSSFQHYDLAHIDTALSAQARVLKQYELKGHKFVELDVAILTRDAAPIAHINHIAIYQPRNA